MDACAGFGREVGTGGDAMTLSIHNTIDWPAEKLLPYGPEITAAMKKLRDKFPREVDIPTLHQEIIAGKRQLWLVLRGDEFVSFVLTSIQTEPTQHKTLFIPSAAGEDGLASVHLIKHLEEWGRENGCDMSVVYGVWGWKRALAEEGYEMDTVLFKKAL